MTRAYDQFPHVSAAQVRAAFEYDPVHGRMLRRFPNGALRACGTGVPGRVYVMWDGVRWPMILLVWLHGHGRWPTNKILRLRGEHTHLTNLMEKPKAPTTIAELEKISCERPKPKPTTPVQVGELSIDFTRISAGTSHNI